MKKIMALLWLLCLEIMVSAQAQVTLTPSETRISNDVAAMDFSAYCACVDPSGIYMYYIATSDSGIHLVRYDQYSGEDTILLPLDANALYAGLCAGNDGTLYALVTQYDETAKPAIYAFIPDGEAYTTVQYHWPGSSGDILPFQIEISPISGYGYVLMTLNGMNGAYTALSLFNTGWGALDGYSALILLSEGADHGDAYPMASLFDAYGYTNDEFNQFCASVENGDILMPMDATIAPAGDRLLLQSTDGTQVCFYVLNLYTLETERIYLPETLNGEVGWSSTNALVATPFDGSGRYEIDYHGFSSEDVWTDWTADGSDNSTEEDLSGLTDWSH